MPTLHIEHAISDFATWSEAFRRFESARRGAGVRGARIQRPIEDPNYVIVDLDFDTVDEAAAFQRFLESRVWSDPANSPALVGSPRARILEPAATGRDTPAVS